MSVFGKSNMLKSGPNSYAVYVKLLAYSGFLNPLSKLAKMETLIEICWYALIFMVYPWI